MKVYDELKEIERKYNMYELSQDEAKEQAKPLIEAYNKKAEEIANKYGIKPSKISIKYFAFGK